MKRQYLPRAFLEFMEYDHKLYLYIEEYLDAFSCI